MTAWEKYRRQGGMTVEPTPLISIRRNAIALNSAFVALAKLEKMSHATIFVDSEIYQVGFRFDNKTPPDGDAIALTSDGGGKKGGGRSIQAQGLIKRYPWLREVGETSEPELRRFKPRREGLEKMWVISLCPPFEHRVSDRSNLPSNARGIYRYKRGEETVYIGRGNIRSRAGAPERDQWDFETIEYSLLSNDEDQSKWEAFWLDRHVEATGKLPIYNRIAGTGTKD